MAHDQIKKGTVELIVLALLERQTMYGYEIIQRVNAQTGGAFIWREASLYPTLLRLEEKGWLAGEWREQPGQRKRKYYALTRGGKRELARQRAEWMSFSSLVTGLLQLSPFAIPDTAR
jgi:PadR family transcriptional regulator PadR